MKFKSRKSKFIIFGASVVLALCAWSFFLWRREIIGILTEASAYFRDTVHLLDGVPLIAYTLIIFILPIFFLPVTPVFIIAASRAESTPFILILLACWLGVTLNIVASYFISRRFGRFLRGVFAKRGIKIPEIPEYEHYELTFLMRMIPGNPLSVQNYVLGMAEVPFMKYVVVSLPIQYIQISAYVYFGEGIFEGGLSKLMLGGGVLAVIAIVARMLDKRYGYKLRRKRDGISEGE